MPGPPLSSSLASLTNELDDRHGRCIAPASTGLEHACVAPWPARHRRSHFVKEAPKSDMVLQHPSSHALGVHDFETLLSAAAYREFAEKAEGFSHVFGFSYPEGGVTVSGEGFAVATHGLTVSGNFFDGLAISSFTV